MDLENTAKGIMEWKVQWWSLIIHELPQYNFNTKNQHNFATSTPHNTVYYPAKLHFSAISKSKNARSVNSLLHLQTWFISSSSGLDHKISGSPPPPDCCLFFLCLCGFPDLYSLHISMKYVKSYGIFFWQAFLISLLEIKYSACMKTHIFWDVTLCH